MPTSTRLQPPACAAGPQALLKAVQLEPYAVTGGQLFVPLTAIALIAGSAIIQVTDSLTE